ncbi:transglutaminase family protein, partial [Methanobacterium sp.]|uniref:transglutaminase-like domain-containing protein n=1 Tax=Methanobacterium sp. TaxID=2164 RepID=UPI0025DE2F3D
QTVQNYIETNKTLPTTVTIGTTKLNMAQFLYLATTATTLLNNGKPTTTTINVGQYTLPTTSTEQLTTELLFKGDYVDFAQRIVEYMNSNKIAPSYGNANIGQVGYKSQIYIYSRILSYYKTNKVLPSNIVVKTWSTFNIPTTGINVTFTIDQIAETATGVKNNVDLYKYLPATANVAGVKISIAQFLYLATKATAQINSKNYNPITLENYNLPSSSSESMSSGSISLSEYVDFASRIASYMVTNKVAPSCGVVGLGYLGYETQIYMFSQVLDSYKTKGALPSSISVKPWITVVYSIPAEYYVYLTATSNCQSDNAQIIALANSITASASTPYEQAVLIFNWVRDNIGYSFYYNTKYGAVGTLNAGTGNCVDTSHLLIALLRAKNIPTRYVHGYCRFSSGSWYGHVWSEVYVNGQWYTADASSSSNTFGTINSWNTATATIYNRYASLPF